MKRTFRLMTVLLIILSLLTSPALAAEEDSGFRERQPPTPFQIGPQWTEMDVTCQSGSNTLRGTLTAPKEIEDTMPVAILLHGLNTNRHWCDDIAWCLADHGIASVRFDFNGNGLSDGASTDMTITQEAQDVDAILDYVEELRFADQEHIFLVGKSMGAVAAMLGTIDRQDEICAACFWYPGFGVSEGTRFGYFLGSFFLPWDPPDTLEIAGYTYGREFLLDAARQDLDEVMEAYDVPLLMLHGDRDYICPLFFSIRARDVFPNAELHVVPRGGHGFELVPEMFSLNDMLSFIQDKL